MFTDPVFRIALILSLSAHIAVIGPRMPEFFKQQEPEVRVVDLNYVIIKVPMLAVQEEKLEADAPKSDAAGFSETEDYIGDVPFVREDLQEESDGEADISEEDRQQSYLKYNNLLREKIRGALSDAVFSDPAGDLEIGFTLSSGGRFLEIESISSNISREERAHILKAVRRAGPFPEFPAELGVSPITFHLVITFST